RHLLVDVVGNDMRAQQRNEILTAFRAQQLFLRLAHGLELLLERLVGRRKHRVFGAAGQRILEPRRLDQLREATEVVGLLADRVERLPARRARLRRLQIAIFGLSRLLAGLLPRLLLPGLALAVGADARLSPRRLTGALLARRNLAVAALGLTL